MQYYCPAAVLKVITIKKELWTRVVLKDPLTIVANNFNYDVPSIHIIRQLKWQTITERRDYLTGVLMYKCIDGTAPNYLADRLVYASQVHDHGTRQVSANALHVPHAHTQYFQRSLTVAGPSLWNNLPDNVRQAQSVPAFKYRYKNYIKTNHIP